MSRTTPRIITERTAKFSTADHSEVQVSYPHDGLPGDPKNGEQQLAFYDADHYASRQFEHGKTYYPDPTPFTDGNFRR